MVMVLTLHDICLASLKYVLAFLSLRQILMPHIKKTSSPVIKTDFCSNDIFK